jgi:chloride channel 7
MSVSAGDQFNISLYDIHVELKCIPFVEGTPPTGMEQMNAYDVATRPVVTMEHVVPVKTVVEVLQTKTHNGFPVITPNNKFVGTILRSQLVVLLLLAMATTSGEAEALPTESSTQTLSVSTK